ncbi:MAG: hypothetical protein K6G58_09410 [Lachnospiraceae bacterium]|nr:hypothetical protein [Lachnospiraceae bacterium]
MIAAVLILINAIAFSMAFRKKIYDTVPAAVFSTVLAVYILALIMPLAPAVIICAAASCAFFIFSFMKLRVRNAPEAEVPSGGLRCHLPLIMLAGVCALFCALMYNRRVFYYDDLSYWGLYTKNIFSIGRLPYLYENCSVDYKDYTPIIQILQYLVQFARSSFSEPLLFMTNVCFIYVLLLPILSAGQKSKSIAVRACSVIFYIIFPHILTPQFYYRLGVDIFLALVFGYAIICCFMEEDERFRLACLISSLSFLVLIKTSGIVLAVFAAAMIAVRGFSGYRESGGAKGRIILSAASPVGAAAFFYLSWQLFLRVSGNNGYLSNRVKSGIAGGGFSLPEYTGEVLRNYLVHFLKAPLNGAKAGATALMLTVFIAAVFLASKDPEGRRGRGMFITSAACLAVFAVSHISMYLFVFDEWEAHGLLEFDRYIMQCLGGLFLAYSVLLIRAARDGFSDTAGKMSTVILVAGTAVFTALLPYADMKQYLLPGGYREMFDAEYAAMAEAAESEWEQSGIGGMDLPHDGTARLTVVADAWDETTQFIEYCAVPQPIDLFINVPAVENDISGFITDHMADYVYVAYNAEKAYGGSWDETAALTDGDGALRAGVLYRAVNENDTKTLRPVR